VFEFMSLCVDWARVMVPGAEGGEGEDGGQERKEEAFEGGAYTSSGWCCPQRGEQGSPG